MIKAYFFDLMGTLASVEDMSPLEDLISEEQHEFLLKNNIGNFNSSDETKEEIENRLYSSKISLYSDSEAVIDVLKEEGYKLAMVSNIYSVSKDKVKRSFSDFLNKFDVVMWSCDAGLMKPDSEIFIKTLEKLNRDYNLSIVPNEIVMIGDKENKDIIPARNLGMEARLIDRTKQSLYDII